MADGHVETFLILNLETWAVAFGNQREIQEMDGGEEEGKDEDNKDNHIDPKMARENNHHGEDSSTLVPEILELASQSQRETEETKGGCEEAKDEVGVYYEETKQSTMTKGDGQVIRVDLKGVL